MRFGNRLFAGALGIVVATSATLVLAAQLWLRDTLQNQFTLQLRRQVGLVAEAVDRDRDLNLEAHRLGDIVDSRVTLIDSTGIVVGDSDFDDRSMELLENHATRPEVVSAFSDGFGVAERVSASTGRAELKVAISAWPGIVRISAPLAQVNSVVRGVTQTIILAALIAIAVGAILAFLAGRAYGNPLKQIAQGAHALAAGDHFAFPSSSIPEIRELVRAFRSMDEELDSRISELQTRRGEIATMIDSMVEGVVSVDSRGRILVCNRSARELLQLDEGTETTTIHELLRQPEARASLDEVLDGNLVTGREIEMYGRNLLLTARPLPEGSAILGFLDVTNVKKLQIMRRDFVANVSHELKTPLTSILGYAETLRDSRLDQETRRHFLNVIHANSHRMQKLVDDLLELATIESGSWEPAIESVDLAAVVRECWSGLADKGPGRHIDMKLVKGDGLRVDADPNALRQIFTNLLDNAVRHSGEGGKITVSAEEEERYWTIRIADTGAGIAVDHLPRVFERFYRVDPARSRAEGGTGLGLSIVKHLVEAHGGAVHVESALGKGTTVQLRLPRL